MIHRLRQRHRRIFTVLAVVLPVAFVAGIVTRKPEARVANLPPELAVAQGVFTSMEWERVDLFPKVAVQVRLLRMSKTAGPSAVSFSAPKDFVKPDLLVYWVAGNVTNTDKLPENAVLLGAFDARLLPLPTAITAEDGSLVLFSLADQEIVDVSKSVRFIESTNRPASKP